MGCRCSSHDSCPVEVIYGEGVDYGNVGDGDALCQGHGDVTPSLRANGGAAGRCVGAGSEAGESAEGSRLEVIIMPAR
jgi:hypothetical protein